MSQSRKITPYIPHSLFINSFHNHKDLLRKKPSKAVQIRIAETLRFYSFPYSYCTKLTKLLKHIKGLKRLSLDHYHLEKTGIVLPSLISLMKKIRRIQELNLSDFCLPLGNFKTKLHLWIKEASQLKKLVFRLKIFRNHIYSKDSFSSNMKSFLKSLKYQNKMSSFKIQLPQKASFVNPILLHSSKYPKSLQKIQLLFNEKQSEGSNEKLPDFHLSSFKKLEAFALQTTNDHFVMSRLMDALPSLPHLKSLMIFLPHSFVIPEASIINGPHCYHIDSQAFCNLTHLSVGIPIEHTEVTLLERLNLENLQSLHLSFYLLNPRKYQEILSNFSKMKKLKALNLSISYFKQLENLTKVLFENIVDLELLTSLRISFASAIVVPDDRPKEEISSDALPVLNKIFQKPIKIEDFSLGCKELIISHKFLELMEIFSASALNFKKFKLDIVPFVLDEGKIEALTGLIEGLAIIRTLKLPCFDVDSNQILTRLTSGIIKFKEIRSICLGKIGEANLEEQPFHESLRSLLEKRGMQSFKCEFTNDFNIRLGVVDSPLSFERISKKNPFLKFVSDNLWSMMNK